MEEYQEEMRRRPSDSGIIAFGHTLRSSRGSSEHRVAMHYVMDVIAGGGLVQVWSASSMGDWLW